jgi:uncharacterized protein YjbI with pentapeptide repeats
VVVTVDANACSCSGLGDPDAFVKGGDIIFTGRAVEVQPTWPTSYDAEPGLREMRTKFVVETSWKGGPMTTAFVDANESGAACGVTFRLGETYTVIAGGSPRTGYRTSYCAMMPLIADYEWRQIQPILETYRRRLMELNQALARDEASNPDTLRAKARLLLTYQDWQPAVDTLSKLLSLQPNDEEAVVGRARALAALGFHDQGLADFEAILVRRPEDSEARQNRILALFQLGRISEIDRETTVLRQKEFVGIDLSGRSLVGFDLTYSRLSNADLRDADLTGANLFQVQFGPEVDVTGARFIGTNLQRIFANDVNFGRAILRYVDFSGAQLARASLFRVDLPAASFRRAELTGTNLAMANLAEAILTDTTGTGTMLMEADLHLADLSKTQLRQAQLNEANLSSADLTNARLYEADLRGANLTSADLRGASVLFARYDCRTKWPPRFDLPSAGAIPVERQCGGVDQPLPSFAGVKGVNRVQLAGLDLSGLSFAGAALSSADFRGSSLRNADLSGAQLKAVNFGVDRSKQATDLGGANLRGAVLERADLRGAILSGANLTDAQLPLALYDCATLWPAGFDAGAAGAVPKKRDCDGRAMPPPDLSGRNLDIFDLSGFDLSGGRFVGADLFRADFSHANLKGADFSRAKLSQSDFSDGSLARANFTGAGLYDADLRDADLTGASLANADLSRADLRDADLTDADLQGVKLKETLYNGSTKFPDGFDMTAAGLKRLD